MNTREERTRNRVDHTKINRAQENERRRKRILGAFIRKHSSVTITIGAA